MGLEDKRLFISLRERLRTHRSYYVFKMIIVISPELPKVLLKSYVVDMY